MSDQVQLIKDRLNIVDVIGQYVKLTKAGKNYKGLSPFSNEKTPSFFVSPDKGMYYDFSSSQGGDIFSFVERMEGVDFRGALQLLAEKAGVALKNEDKNSRNERDRIFSALEEACCFFETKLKSNFQAIQYLKTRGLKKSTMRSFRLGFAEDKWQGIHDHLKSVGYTKKEMEKAGLIKKGDSGRYYDRFRSRIMFPIMDTTGRVVAFSGRIFGEPSKDEKNAKYLNSPETILFDKGRILYGYNKAKQFIRKYDFSILVEGQMDLVLSHQAGYANTVAVSGTGLTNDHLILLNRVSKKLVMAFDADTAGITSSGRAAKLALNHEMDVKVAKVTHGKDPADCILESVETWKNVIKNARHVVDYYLDIVLNQSKELAWDNRKLVLQARDIVFPYVALVKSASDQSQFVRNISNVLGITEEAVWTDVQLIKNTIDNDGPHIENVQNIGQADSEHASLFSREEDIEKTLASILFWQESLKNKNVEEKILKKNAREMMVSLEEILAKYSEEKETLAFQAEVSYVPTDTITEIVNNLITELAKIQLAKKLSLLSQKQKVAERENNQTEIKKLEKEVIKLSDLKRLLSKTP